MAVVVNTRTHSTSEKDVADAIAHNLDIAKEELEIIKTGGNKFLIRSTTQTALYRIATGLKIPRWSVEFEQGYLPWSLLDWRKHQAAELYPGTLVNPGDDGAPVSITISYCFEEEDPGCGISLGHLYDIIKKQIDTEVLPSYIVSINPLMETLYIAERDEPRRFNKIVTVDVKGILKLKYVKEICDCIYTTLKLTDDYCMIRILNGGRCVHEPPTPSPSPSLSPDFSEEIPT